MQRLTNLRMLRQEAGLSQEKMASKIGVTLSYYEKVERGKVPASSGFMRKVRRAFPKCSIDNIFFADEQQQNCQQQKH